MDHVFVSLLLLCLVAATLYFGQTKAGKLLLPILRSVVESLSYWNYSANSKKKLAAAAVLFNLGSRAGVDDKELERELTRIIFLLGLWENLSTEESVRLTKALYVVISQHRELAGSVQGLLDHERLDVKKTTLLLIDILGELFDRSDKLSADYFQALIVGLNKALLIVKKHGYTKDSVKDISSTLFRVYRITQAYMKQEAGKGLTEKEFYEKVSSIINRFVSTYN